MLRLKTRLTRREDDDRDESAVCERAHSPGEFETAHAGQVVVEQERVEVEVSLDEP